MSPRLRGGINMKEYKNTTFSLTLEAIKMLEEICNAQYQKKSQVIEMLIQKYYAETKKDRP